MKKITTISFFVFSLFIVTLTNAQNTNYLVHISDSGSFAPSGIVSLSDGTLIVSGTSLLPSADANQKSGFLYMLDETGVVLDKSFITNDSTSISVYSISKISGDSILLMALSKPYHDNNTAPDSILIMRFDQNLNLIERRSFPLSGVNEYQTMKAVVFNQFVYFSIMELKNSHLYYSLHKVDLESDTIFSKYYNDDYFASPTIWDIDFNIADSTLLLVYTYNHPLFDTSQTIYGAKTFITYFNSDLEYNSELDTTLNMFNGVSAIFHEVDSNILFMYGIGGSLENNITAPCSSHPKLCKINIENSLVDCIDVFHNVDTACYTSLNNIVQIGANLYCFGFFNVRPLEMPWQYDRTYILLAKVDTALQIQNIRLVGEDYCYMTFASCATADSNVVVAGTYFDYNASDERYQVFLLKTDQNLSLGIHDQEDLWNDLSVYSNPASNNITLEIPDNNTAGLVYIFNSAGSVVKSVLLEGNQKIIDVSGLVAGNYFISFITENGQAYSGQFVKE